MEKAKKVRELRESLGMSRKQFCEHFQIPYRTVSEWEKDGRHAPDYVLKLLEYSVQMEKSDAGKKILNTTLCYLIKGDQYLMLHRTKKENDINKDKWIGVGGKVQDGESPEDCVDREVFEETGYRLAERWFRGIVTFIYGNITEYMFLFTSENFDGEERECDEGDLVWVNRKDVYDLPIWEGDKIFFRLLEEQEKFFSLKLVYDENQVLTKAELDGAEI